MDRRRKPSRQRMSPSKILERNHLTTRWRTWTQHSRQSARKRKAGGSERETTVRSRRTTTVNGSRATETASPD
ncbi:hypothetical protein BV898_13874 [Hypsibius exemplaris]|uniref:Uncharacterized protein n=1 Tax=Hypsibius exemplaris TaxID=2072580 RepID=A0A1W0W9H6_HYPEX|nr:hypothetical protein BV898_13874 [Hypsibius exemplaris]